MLKAHLLFRRAAEAGLVFLLAASLAYPWTGMRLHEAAGLVWFAFVLWHAALNRRWFASLLKGPYSRRRAAALAVNAALLAACAALCLSGLMLAYGTVGAQEALALRRTHLGAAYWTLVLCGLHAGMYAGRIFGAPRRKWRVAAALALVWGGWSFWFLEVCNKLSFGFAFGASNASLPPFLAAVAGVFFSCACLTHYLFLKGERK